MLTASSSLLPRSRWPIVFVPLVTQPRWHRMTDGYQDVRDTASLVGVGHGSNGHARPTAGAVSGRNT
jgi:hypothetical protein